jgi:hypothetical protein
MSEQTSGRGGENDDVTEAGSTDEAQGNLTLEDDAHGTTDPADLAGTADAGDEGVR